MSKSHTVIPVSIIGTSTTTKCMICLEDHILKNVIKHSLCSAIICKECIKQMPDEQVKRCVYCRRDTMEFYNKKYENISENIRNFSNNDNNNNNININIFGETTPPIHININNRSSNRRRMSVRSFNIDNLFQEKNCCDYIIDFVLCICKLRTIHYLFMFTILNAMIMVVGLIILVMFTTEIDDGIKVWIIYLTGVITMTILYFCASCCMWVSSGQHRRVSNQRIFD